MRKAVDFVEAQAYGQVMCGGDSRSEQTLLRGRLTSFIAPHAI